MENQVLTESLQKAKDGIDFCLEDLREANKFADPVEHLLIIKIMQDISKAKNEIDALVDAKEAMRKEQDQGQKRKITFKPVA